MLGGDQTESDLIHRDSKAWAIGLLQGIPDIGITAIRIYMMEDTIFALLPVPYDTHYIVEENVRIAAQLRSAGE